MQIASIQAYALKIPPEGADSGAGNDQVESYGDYTIAADAWTSIYSRNHETCLVRLETDDGLVGWGEGQAPVAPRATAAIVEELCAPLVLGRDPFDVEYIWYRLYSAMRERGHVTGFYVDALAAVDLAFTIFWAKPWTSPFTSSSAATFDATCKSTPAWAGHSRTPQRPTPKRCSLPATAR